MFFFFKESFMNSIYGAAVFISYSCYGQALLFLFLKNILDCGCGCGFLDDRTFVPLVFAQFHSKVYNKNKMSYVYEIRYLITFFFFSISRLTNSQRSKLLVSQSVCLCCIHGLKFISAEDESHIVAAYYQHTCASFSQTLRENVSFLWK